MIKDILDKIKKWSEESIVDDILIFAALIAIVESLAQNTIKSSKHDSYQFMLGLSIYILIGYILHYAYHSFPLAKLNIMWSCISIILGVSMGYVLYNEPINQYSILSLVFALCAVLASSYS